MKQTLSLRLTNKLALTVSLKQQLSLLMLPKLELQETIKQELEENPFLEEISTLEAQFQPIQSNYAYSQEDEEFTIDKRLAYKPTLLDTLNFQIELEFEGQDKQIAFEIVGNLNSKGLLEVPVEEISKKLNVPIEHIERIREKIKRLEPTGIASKTIEEALITQYEENYGKDPIAERLIKEDAYNLKDTKYLTEKYNISEEELKDKICSIKMLVPYPTYNYDLEETQYIEPDIFIYDLGDKFEIKINEKGLPNIRLTTQYRKLISQKDLPEKTKKFLEEKLQKAIGIIKGIQQRRENLYKIAELLVKHQSEFLRKGKEHLRPLILKDVANQLGLHESTVSRIVSSKYAQTPLGVIPLKAFFSTKLSSSEGDVSTEKVKHLIKEIIEKENKRKPLSDEAISKILRKEYGIKIARRTVAKYREEMKILDSRKRRVQL